jgi:hypothetical protein
LNAVNKNISEAETELGDDTVTKTNVLKKDEISTTEESFSPEDRALQAWASIQPANGANKDSKDTGIKLEDAAVGKPTEPKTEVYTSLGQSTLLDRSVEDEVDWDNDEL